MADALSFETFKDEVSRLTGLFQKKIGIYETEGYDEASLRNDFLTPFWRALAWDTENREGLPQLLREVEIETRVDIAGRKKRADRSEEHTSELQSPCNLVCRLLLEKKNSTPAIRIR